MRWFGKSKYEKHEEKIRIYPKIKAGLPSPIRPISFICVKYSDEFQYNIATSECIHYDLNEFIVVDNQSDVFFNTLGQAINAGISQARNDLLVIVHEDVVLLPGWQAMFEKSLTDLEQHDSDWLVVGLVGWNENNKLRGHLSDPHAFYNTLGEKSFSRVASIDEQVLVIRKSKGLFPDVDLPSIHNIGRDLVWSAAKKGGATYVVNAPPIHKYADAAGKLVLSVDDSIKIQNRKEFAYIHNKKCSDEYLQNKWKEKFDGEKIFDEKELTEQKITQLNSPIILLGRGGSGTRLVSVMASDIGLFIGNGLDSMGDCHEMVGPIYRAIFRKHRCPSIWQKSLIIPDLRESAIKMLQEASWPNFWGFKIPESLLILPELQEAFPEAKFVFLKRDPLTTVLRRTHITSRLDNEIGRTLLPLAYDFAKLPRETIFKDVPSVHMAHGTAHQINLTMTFKSSIPENHWHEINFENIMTGSKNILDKFADFCGHEIISESVFQTIDKKQAFGSKNEFSREIINNVEKILSPSRKALCYL